MSEEDSPLRDGLKVVLSLLRGLGDAASTMIESRLAALVEFERREIARAARILALNLVAALFVFAATAFAALAILWAAGAAHRVAAAAGIAGAFGVLALIALRLTADR
jgi:uncharacterized membrane protein YqjE